MKETISIQELLAQAGFKELERFEYFDSGIIEVYSKMKPMTREEYVEMKELNYMLNDDIVMASSLIESPQDYVDNSLEIRVQIIADYCFGETYMLRD